MQFLRRLALTVVAWGWLGCASGPSASPEPATYGVQEGRVWVSGPWKAVAPSQNADDVIDQLCPAIMRLPRAQAGDHGQEYCGVIYTLEDGTYYASHPSPLGDTRVGRVSSEKNCYVPRVVRDVRGQTVPIGDYHSHPWSPSPMTTSRRDRVAATQIYSIRIQFDKACHLQKLIPYMNEARPGELYERRGKSWKLIGLIRPENKANGAITRVDD
ncbi:hypothetical protein [Stigmatella aurantiaca]|uniref:Conserved uncharacterized protein n=1 Tax=Stigmatella aurantiaca (strain DW4/3-1) TaxID=378806 RepID=Q091I0_STIAD|nr:hypothetical protein [Stigmatella aurantiaca]ADO68846.1 conserved uncharacterized protein [Stigmatella aurantiaca DW4/3-1]EAU66404.1 hypothetical protein STIAU_8865 [Stigmatella aurantiaca DW4/3-1]